MLPANCPSIKGIGNGVVDTTGRRYNDTVTVTCHEGSRYTGTSFRVCLRNGSWSGKNGLCEGEKILLKCSLPQTDCLFQFTIKKKYAKHANDKVNNKAFH